MGLADRDYMRVDRGARLRARAPRPRLRDRLLFLLWETWRRLRRGKL